MALINFLTDRFYGAKIDERMLFHAIDDFNKLEVIETPTEIRVREL